MPDIKYFKSLIESALLTEAKTLIDNFDKVARMMEFNSDDDFYFVQIIKRFKDNKGDNKFQGNYHGGAWYPFKGIRVRSAEELISLKPQIIKMCDDNNARAYITVNTRSMKDTDNQIIKFRSRHHKSDPRHIHADDIVAAQPRPIEGKPESFENWKGKRPRFFIDVDPTPEYTADPQKLQWLFDEVRKIIKMCGMTVIDEYLTPSGGLHLILPNREHENMEYLVHMLQRFDDWEDKKRNALAHANIDGKIILYSNVDTKGY